MEKAMKKLLLIIMLALMGNELMSQTFFVYDIETSSFPTLKAKFYATDSLGNRILNLSPSDIIVKEDGMERKVLSVSCPDPQPPKALSAVLVIDASGSMFGKNILMAKRAAIAWVEAIPLGKSECAITSFNTRNLFIQDFTTDRNRLDNQIIFITAGGGTDYNAAFTKPKAGGILVAKNGKNKRVIVMLTDGYPNFEPNTTNIVDLANENDITVYCVTLGNVNPPSLIEITSKTGGLLFTKITSEDQAKEVYLKILQIAQDSKPCTIEWQSEYPCRADSVAAEFTLTPADMKNELAYLSPADKTISLSVKPSSIKFINAVPGIQRDSTITVTANNDDFEVTNIISSNPQFQISPSAFTLNSGESKVLNVSFTPVDSGYVFSKFSFENDKCLNYFYCSGGFPGKKPSVQTLKLIHPNGGEVFVAGSDTVITWEGVLPEEPVKIEYSTDNGVNWIEIENKAANLSYKWHVPKTPSNQCLARVTAGLKYYGCDGSPLSICQQEWSPCNLDVDTYRNGDIIRYCETQGDWVDAANNKEGAWCYYDNDPANGDIYGKLYNWFAVTDPRGLAPQGWHIPTASEWSTLVSCVGGQAVAGGKLKSTGTIEGKDGYWLSPNLGAEDQYGFSGQPGGSCNYDGTFNSLGAQGLWWTANSSSIDYAQYFILYFDYAHTFFYTNWKANGLSVRCVRD